MKRFDIVIADFLAHESDRVYHSNGEFVEAEVAQDLLEALEAAMAFIDSHVADPDLTDEMCEAYARLLALEPRKLIAKAKGDDHERI